jgi:hypothetical protein
LPDLAGYFDGRDDMQWLLQPFELGHMDGRSRMGTGFGVHQPQQANLKAKIAQ